LRDNQIKQMPIVYFRTCIFKKQQWPRGYSFNYEENKVTSPLFNLECAKVRNLSLLNEVLY
jgi:hypothetical protein